MIILWKQQDIKKEVPHLDKKDFRLVVSNNAVRPSRDFNKMRIDGKIYKDDVTINTSKFGNIKHRKKT